MSLTSFSFFFVYKVFLVFVFIYTFCKRHFALNKDMFCTCFVIILFDPFFSSVETGVALTSYFPVSIFRVWGFLLSGLWRNLQRGNGPQGASLSTLASKRVLERSVYRPA